MHIAIPIHSFEPGGVERVALRLADRWQASGQRVSIVLGRRQGLISSQVPELDYRTLPEPISTARWETIWMIWSLYRFLLSERVDVLFCPGNTYTIVCVAMRLFLGERCPPVLVKVSNDLDRSDIGRAFRPFHRLWSLAQGFFLDHFVALAEPMLPQIVNELGISRDKASVIADPALSAEEVAGLSKSRAPRKDGNCRFLSIGRLAKQKNHALLIEAFALHSWPGDSLVIAGEGPERRALEYIIRRRNLEDRVSLIGHCDELAPLLAQSDVFVLSSDYEGVPAVILEALAAGLPIAATDCCASMQWLLQDGQFGLVTPTRDADALGIAMNAARHIDPPRQQMAEFAAQFTLERAAGAYLEIFDDLATAQSDEQFSALSQQLRVWQVPGV